MTFITSKRKITKANADMVTSANAAAAPDVFGQSDNWGCSFYHHSACTKYPASLAITSQLPPDPFRPILIEDLRGFTRDYPFQTSSAVLFPTSGPFLTPHSFLPPLHKGCRPPVELVIPLDQVTPRQPLPVIILQGVLVIVSFSASRRHRNSLIFS